MTKYQAVLTAVNWWADKINKPEPHSNGDNSAASVFACLFADMMQEKITEQQILTFRAALAEKIDEQIAREIEVGYSGVLVYLACDYHPCDMLFDAAQEAGISKSNFPYKTNMMIESKDGRNYSVSVSDGYAQPYVELYPVHEGEQSKDNGIRVRRTAADICNLFEHLLDKHDITIPDEDRTGGEDEARLYGVTYFNLEQEVTDVLRSLIEEVKANPEAPCEYNDY